MRSGSRLVAALLVLAVLAAVLYDLYGPRHGRLSEFDPAAVARIETAMWRADQADDDGLQFRTTASQLRTRFHLPLLRSYSVAYEMARATYLFDQGRARSEYTHVLPQLEEYYEAIRTVNRAAFEPSRVAQLELEEWIVRRQREEHAPEDLATAVAALQAAIYAVPPEALAEHARLRAEALDLRDVRATTGGPTKAEWRRIEDLLRGSWEALWRAVQS